MILYPITRIDYIEEYGLGYISASDNRIEYYLNDGTILWKEDWSGFNFTEGTDNLLEPTGYQYYPVYEEVFDKEGNILPGIKILAGFRYE